MGKRGRRNKSSKKNLGSAHETVSGRTLFTLSAASSTIFLNPSSFPRCLAMADVFNLYRFTRLRFTVKPGSQTSVGYSNGEFDTPPTTVQQIMELAYAALVPGSQTVPESVTVPKSELLGDSTLKWYKTIAGTPASGFENQGALYWLAGGAVFLLVEWTCEFSQWNLAANSPLKTPSAVSKNDDSISKPKSWYERSDDVIVVGGVTYRKSEVLPSPSALSGQC